MKYWTLFSLFLTLSYEISLTAGHGLMVEPPARNSMWRQGFPSPPDYGDNELFCGGIKNLWETNGGKCGICGDSYNRERKHETGGLFARNITTRMYQPGSVVDVLIQMVANHGGNFQFEMCWRNSFDEIETENCFENLKILNGEEVNFTLDPKRKGLVGVSLQLPEEKTCERCILRWHWKAANNWGICEDGTAATGCGPQEIYRNCADVAVGHEFGIRGPFGSNHFDYQMDWNFRPRYA